MSPFGDVPACVGGCANDLVKAHLACTLRVGVSLETRSVVII